MGTDLKPENEIKADIVDNLRETCIEYGQEYINTLENPQDIYENNGLFVGMLKYIYMYYLKGVLKNNNGVNNRYDYDLLDRLFYIYTDMVYRYKKNKQPYINEFCIFVNISRETLYNIKYGLCKKVTPEVLQRVKNWFTECEQGLLNTDTVGSIFRLKSMFNYNDNLAPVPIEMQGTVLSAGDLPELGQLKIAKKDTKKG